MMRLIAATPEHNARLLGLLEENAMPGEIDLVMTRRPDYFAAQPGFGVEHPAIALEGECAIGMCQLTEHAGFVNGRQRQLGYLGSLRVTQGYRQRIRVIRAGFDYLRQLAPPDYCYTSIAADNHVARRLLERGLSGLPEYRLLGEMNTLAMVRKQGKRRGLWSVVPPEEYPLIVDFYHRMAAQRQLAPRLDTQWLCASGLPVLGFSDAQGLHACAVLWNQQAFKQILAARYSPRVHWLRPLWNGYAACTGRVPLPKVGQALDQSFLAYFASDNGERISELVEDALSFCTTQVMTLGLPAGTPLIAKLIARTRPLLYRTCLYGVNLTASPVWDTRSVWPEVALL